MRWSTAKGEFSKKAIQDGLNTMAGGQGRHFAKSGSARIERKQKTICDNSAERKEKKRDKKGREGTRKGARKKFIDFEELMLPGDGLGGLIQRLLPVFTAEGKSLLRGHRKER